ncbi:hypothetical protein BGZ83_007389 [Gryganskiella cystojenkinii]|nr:hypothetical protein BGZ83_007389 [Gryganskiella cystojenkinii]
MRLNPETSSSNLNDNSSSESNDHDLTWHSWLVVITFMVVIVIVIRPIRIPLPALSLLSRKKRSPAPLVKTPSSVAATAIAVDQPIQWSATGTSVEQQNNTPSNTTITATEGTTPTQGANSNNTNTNLNLHPEEKETAPTAITPASLQSQQRRHHFTLGIASAPVLGVLFLLATGSLNVESIQDGIVGAPGTGVEPYAVMILFFSLAYICISLDMTGVFQFAAFWISKRGGGGQGQRVFLSFFLLSTLMSGLAGNDVVVLTMTPFLVYYSHAVELVTPIAFLMAEIQTANIGSMALYIGNLTNVVACQAYKISFLEYSAWMLLPCLASVASCYVMLRINFRHEKYIPKQLKIPDIDPRSCLVDPFGAVFGLSVLALSLICLIGTSFAHVSVWIVTGPFALLTLFRDVCYDYQGKYKGPRRSRTLPVEDEQGEEEENSDVNAAKEAEEEEVERLGKEAAIESYGKGGDVGRIEQGLPPMPLPEVAVPDANFAHPITILEHHPQEQKKGLIPAVVTSNSNSSPRLGGHKRGEREERGEGGEGGEGEKKGASIIHCTQITPAAAAPTTFTTTENTTTGTTETVDALSLALTIPESVSPSISSSSSSSSPSSTTATSSRPSRPQAPQTATLRQRPLPRNDWVEAFERRMPLLYAIAIRMPWAILPFTFSMFIMVEGLSDVGWISIFARWATHLVPNYIAATYAIGFVSVLLCNIFNNVPMTILVARILQHPEFANHPLATEEVVKGCLFGLIVGSNLGACTTLISSLAGLMWDSVLRSKKSQVGFWNFFKWNMGVMPVVIFVALSAVVVELTVYY